MARHVDRKCISDGKHRDVIACVIPALNLIYLCTHTFVLVWQKFRDSSPRSNFQKQSMLQFEQNLKKNIIIMIIIENGKWKFEKFLDYSFRSKLQKNFRNRATIWIEFQKKEIEEKYNFIFERILIKCYLYKHLNHWKFLIDLSISLNEV